MTIVGSRRCGAYGREVAHELARELAAAGIVVVSGLALGIDSAAHEGALAGGGTTIAVLGPGADRAYPRSADGLYRRICASGAVVSELAPGAADVPLDVPRPQPADGGARRASPSSSRRPSGRGR